MNHSDTPVNGSKSHDPDLLNHSLTNGNEKGNGHRDDCDDCLVREKLNQSQDPEGENETVVFSRPEAIWRKTFLVTRVTLGSANLMSLCLKFPLIILIIRMVVELAQAKASETQVTTIEPPYEEEVVQPVSSGDSGSPDDAKSQKQAFIVQIALLALMYVGILLVHVLCVFYYWMNKGLFHLFLYLPLVGMWLALAIPSGFVQSWSWSWTNFMFLVLQSLIHGNDLFGTPSKTEFRLVRASIWLDLVTFILSCFFIFLSRRLSKELKSERLCCRPQYNLLKLL